MELIKCFVGLLLIILSFFGLIIINYIKDENFSFKIEIASIILGIIAIVYTAFMINLI